MLFVSWLFYQSCLDQYPPGVRPPSLTFWQYLRRQPNELVLLDGLMNGVGLLPFVFGAYLLFR